MQTGSGNLTQSQLQNLIKDSYYHKNGMGKPGHEKRADNSHDVKQVIKTLKRGCRISQDFIKNNFDKMRQPDEYGKQLC